MTEQLKKQSPLQWANAPVTEFEASLPEALRTSSLLVWDERRIGQGVLAIMNSMQKAFGDNPELLRARAWGICLENLMGQSAILQSELTLTDLEAPSKYFQCEVILATRPIEIQYEVEHEFDLSEWARVLMKFYSPEFWGYWVKQTAQQLKDESGERSVTIMGLLATALWNTPEFRNESKSLVRVESHSTNKEGLLSYNGFAMVRRGIALTPLSSTSA